MRDVIAAPVKPRTTDQATALLDKYAQLGSAIASIETERNKALASTNAVADTLASPLIEQQRLIAAVLEPWWAKAAAELTKGKRKSIELGGCMIGSKKGTSTLVHSLVNDDAAVAALRAARWAKAYVRTTYSIDRAATLKAMDGTHKAKLEELGFSIKSGVETFFVQRVVQQGTVAAVG